MSKNLPTRTAPAPARFIFIPEPARPVVQYTPRELAAQRAANAIRYARWRERQDILLAREAKTRRVMQYILLVLVLAALTVAGIFIWQLWQLFNAGSFDALDDIGLTLLGYAALGVVLTGGFGCGCVLIIRHYH